jgi:curved DNA-binding protein CbpA
MAVTDVLSLDEFVDLYKILEISPTSSETELRERVNKLYLEAQRNIDHHNFRKRFYYQQLYEVHLPQAHQLLLDSARRTEYDSYLDAFNKGLPFPIGGTGAAPATTHSGELGRLEQVETNLLPTVNAAPSAIPTTPSAPPTGTAAKPPSAKPADAPGAAKPTKPAAPPRPTPKAAPSKPVPQPAWAQRVTAELSEAERRRDHKRRELIKGELVAAGQTWGWGIGVATFLVLGALAFLMFQGKPALQGSGVGVALLLAYLAGTYAVREARRRIVGILSKMPYDELLRRCAR